jgi:hypothetical protein
MRWAEVDDEDRSVSRAARGALTLALLYNGYLILASWVVGSAEVTLLPLILILALSRLFFGWLCSRGLSAPWALLLTTIPALIWVGTTNLSVSVIYGLYGPQSYTWMSWPASLVGSLVPYAGLIAVGLSKRRTT